MLTSAPMKNSTAWMMCHFTPDLHHLLVLAAQSILVLAPFPEIGHILNYVVCHRALIHINQERSHGAQLVAKLFSFHCRFKRNYRPLGHYVLQFLV